MDDLLLFGGLFCGFFLHSFWRAKIDRHDYSGSILGSFLWIFCILFGGQKSIDTITVAPFWDHFWIIFASFESSKSIPFIVNTCLWAETPPAAPLFIGLRGSPHSSTGPPHSSAARLNSSAARLDSSAARLHSSAGPSLVNGPAERAVGTPPPPTPSGIPLGRRAVPFVCVLGGGGVPTYYHCAFERECAIRYTHARPSKSLPKSKVAAFWAPKRRDKKAPMPRKRGLLWIFLVFLERKIEKHDNSGSILGSFLDHFCIILGLFGIIFGRRPPFWWPFFVDFFAFFLERKNR